jgi:hypothetical protein
LYGMDLYFSIKRTRQTVGEKQTFLVQARSYKMISGSGVVDMTSMFCLLREWLEVHIYFVYTRKIVE